MHDRDISRALSLSAQPGRASSIKQAFFVTGTDTDAGKTTIAAGLLAAARQQGLSTLACKPVASGSQSTDLGLRNHDAMQLASQCSITLPYTSLNPYAFVPAIAPHLAAVEAGVQLDCQQLQQAIEHVLAHQADLTVVEGAGGWRVPVNSHETLADLAAALQLPVVLVVGMKLGCINHALLSAEAILRDGLPLAGWIANSIDPHMSRQPGNLQTLQQLMPAPCLASVPHLPDTQPAALVPHLAPALARLLSHPPTQQ